MLGNLLEPCYGKNAAMCTLHTLWSLMCYFYSFTIVWKCQSQFYFGEKYFFLKGWGSKTILHVKYKPSLEVGSKVGVNTRSQKLTACPHKKPSIVSLFLLHPLHASDAFGDSDCVFGQCPPTAPPPSLHSKVAYLLIRIKKNIYELQLNNVFMIKRTPFQP